MCYHFKPMIYGISKHVLLFGHAWLMCNVRLRDLFHIHWKCIWLLYLNFIGYFLFLFLVLFLAILSVCSERSSLVIRLHHPYSKKKNPVFYQLSIEHGFLWCIRYKSTAVLKGKHSLQLYTGTCGLDLLWFNSVKSGKNGLLFLIS